jgi:type III secretion system-like peptide-binding chaperone
MTKSPESAPPVRQGDPRDLLAHAVRKQTEERRDVLIIEWADEPRYYVQFPHPETVAMTTGHAREGDPEWLYSEAVSDLWLPPALHIGDDGASALEHLGWRPAKSPRDSLTDVYVEGSDTRNWFRVFPLNVGEPYEGIAETIVETFRAAFRCTRGFLKIEMSRSSTRRGFKTDETYLIPGP